VARAHAIAPVIEDATGQQSLGLHSRHLMTVHLLVQFGLDGVEQSSIDNSGLLACEDFALEDYFFSTSSIWRSSVSVALNLKQPDGHPTIHRAS
jgi:hypothetical protein